ncbi:DUF3325 domain-containing protein [Telluria beijingensis]|uniref:DUF3325 domain-containing protein n=1 Tax=Telluria beijingensis TaxID=3068633 RepID=UPI0027960B51|nr:DUF3325 domain-containing protein [Massilia sp. REN29]
MTTIIVFGLCYLAMLAVCATMARHVDDLPASTWPAASRRLLRAGGWLLLAAALAPAIHYWGVSVGIAAWLGLLTFASAGLALQLTYRPASVQGAALAAGAIVIVAWAL